MSHHDLLEYIRQAKSKGASDAAISDRLHGAGWYRVDVQDGLELYRKIDGSAQLASASLSPRRSSRSVAYSAHSYDSNIVAIAVLAFLVGFLGCLLLMK